MSTHNDLQSTALELLCELDLRQDALLEELDSVSNRLDAVLAEYVKSRLPKSVASKDSEISAAGCSVVQARSASE